VVIVTWKIKTLIVSGYSWLCQLRISIFVQNVWLLHSWCNIVHCNFKVYVIQNSLSKASNILAVQGYSFHDLICLVNITGCHKIKERLHCNMLFSHNYTFELVNHKEYLLYDNAYFSVCSVTRVLAAERYWIATQLKIYFCQLLRIEILQSTTCPKDWHVTKKCYDRQPMWCAK